MASNSTDLGTDKSPWTQPGFLAAAVIVAILLVLGVLLAVTGGRADNGTTAAPPPPPPPGAPAPDLEASACGLPAGDADVPVEPPSASWELVGKMIAPTRPETVGPGRTNGGYRTCFAHSPVGALYAGVNFWAALTAKPSANVYRRLASPSPARATAIQNARREPSKRLEGGLQVAGFVFGSYEPDRATVKLAFRLEDGRLVAADTTMLWADGDWRYEVPLDQARGSVGQIPDLGGLVAWKGT